MVATNFAYEHGSTSPHIACVAFQDEYACDRENSRIARSQVTQTLAQKNGSRRQSEDGSEVNGIDATVMSRCISAAEMKGINTPHVSIARKAEATKGFQTTPK
jgi:hypothetical protein